MGSNTPEEALASLPPELLLHSLSYLDAEGLSLARSVCRRYRSVASDDFLWERQCRRRWMGKQNVDRFSPRGEGVDADSDRGEHVPSWRHRFVIAEADAVRDEITREELVHFRWRLVYNGIPSNMGLRRFQPDGLYASPYLGLTEWHLHENNLIFSGMSLPIERSRNNWGWVIGKGSRTEYHSVEV